MRLSLLALFAFLFSVLPAMAATADKPVTKQEAPKKETVKKTDSKTETKETKEKNTDKESAAPDPEDIVKEDVDADSKEDAPKETSKTDKQDAEDEKAGEAPVSNEHSKAGEAKTPVNWVDVESTGVLGTGKEGAIEKTIWKGQKRSEIEPLLQDLPTTISLRSVLSLQRRLLLSKTDSSLIVNDIGPLRGNDMLIQRINKLMDMGLYDDAWELYTQKAEDPYDVSISQLGMLLLLMKNDLATACLEEKVSSSRYPEDAFFRTLDLACASSLGETMKKSAGFQSPVLKAVYETPTYTVSAADPQTLSKMTDLERALVLANGKIRYTGLTKEIAANTPDMLLGLYLLDKKLPPDALAILKAETDSRGITRYISTVRRDENWKKVKDLSKDPQEQWPLIESAILTTKNSADLFAYVDYIETATPANLSTEVLTKALRAMLATGTALPDFWLDAAQKRASQNPIIYIYLQAFKSLTPTKGITVKVEDFTKSLQSLKPADSDQILAIIESLDKDAGVLNNPLRIYEKHSDLTLEGNYVMPSVGLNVLLETAPDKKQLGITTLAVLNALYAKPDNMYSGTIRKALYSMLNVGLLEDATLIGSETVASVLNKY